MSSVDAKPDHVRVFYVHGDDDNYCVMVLGTDGRELERRGHATALAARSRAMALASAHAIPLHDSSLGEEIVREPGRLDEPLQSWARRLGWLARPLPKPPDELHGRYHLHGGRCVIHLPPARLAWRHVETGIAMGFSLAFLIGAFWLLAKSTLEWGPVLGIIIVGLIGSVLLGMWVYGYTVHQRLEADPKLLKVTTRWGPFERSRSLRTEEILELVVSHFPPNEPPSEPDSFPGQEPIVVLTLDNELRFAHYLPRAERLWMRQLLVSVLAGGAATAAEPE